MRDECEHGSLRRSCEICERDARIAELEAQVAVLREALEEHAASVHDCPGHGLRAYGSAVCSMCSTPGPMTQRAESALSTDSGQRAAAVLKAAREWALERRTARGEDGPDELYRLADALHAAIDALDGRV